MKKLIAILLTAALLCTAFAVAAAAFASPSRDAERIRFEGYVVGDGQGNNTTKWIGFWSDELSETEELGFLIGSLAGAYYNGNIYGYLYGYNNSGELVTSYYVMDQETHFVEYPEGASAEGEMVYGMAYNYADNTMYAMCDENNTYIARVDLETGVLTKVVDINLGSYLGLQTFAIDDQGNFYALTFSALNARLVRINISTGALTEIMSTNLPTYYAQSMTWDSQTQAIYWAQVDGANSSSNGMYKIDPVAKTLSYMGMIGSNLELTCLMVIPDYDTPVPTAYTVTFYDIEGNVLDVQEVEEGEDAVAPEAPEVEGYTFIGWDADYTNVTSDLDIYPIYEQNASDILLGDVDCNGVVNFTDISVLYAFLLNQASVTEQGQLNADVNQDGIVSFTDVSALYAFLVGA